MRQKLKQTSSILLIVILTIGLLPIAVVHAEINSCEGDFDNNQMGTNSSADFDLTLQDTNSVDIQWVYVASPSPDLSIQNVTADPGWTINQTSDDVTFTNGDISPGASLHATITLAADNTSGNSNWIVQASDDPGGANAVTCTGQQYLTVTAEPPVISDVSLTNLSDTSVTVDWDTDQSSDSTVSYGLDENYGTNAYDPTLTTTHSLMLTALDPNTFYHFQITSSNENGAGVSDDNTFLTPLKPPPPVKDVTPLESTTTIVSPIDIQVTDPNDKIPPTINLTSNLPRVVTALPTISGIAADNLAVVRVEYSTDGGLDWLPVDNAPDLGGKQVNFSFTPIGLDDGTYIIMARAIDPGGNITVTQPITTVIDRVPPIVGGSVISVGSQLLEPDSDGVIHTVASTDLKISLSAVGGATNISLGLKRIGQGNAATADYNLTQSSDSGLWSGSLSFSQSGNFQVMANAIDGAGNKTTRVISTVSVAAAGIVYAGNSARSAAKVTVYYLEPESQNWTVWDGSAYGQSNPQLTNKNGQYNLFLPAGKYYLKTSAKGFETLTSSIFTLATASPVTSALNLKKEGGFYIGSLHIPWFNFATTPIDVSGQAKSSNLSTPESLLGKISPDFTLMDLKGNTVHTVDLLGKPTVLTFLTTWAPSTSEQLPILSQLQANHDINVEPIAIGENQSEVQNYNTLGGYSANWLLDPDNSTVSNYNVSALPMHYFLDQNGVVQKIVPGVLTEQQILDDLGGL